MKAAIVNLVAALLIAASILLGFGMLWEQREKQHKKEISELKKLDASVYSIAQAIARNAPRSPVTEEIRLRSLLRDELNR